MHATAPVLLGDGIAGLRGLTQGSVDLILSDLPSGETRANFDKKADMASLWPAVMHALQPSGVVVFMALSFRFACEVRASAPTEPLDMIWEKSLATGHLNAKRQPLKSHEYILVFRPGMASSKGVFHPQMTEGASPIHAARRTSHGENYGAHSRVTESRAGATDRFPTTVLHFASVGTTAPERRHPQQKPVPLLRYLIETYSTPGNVVVDPYAGSGSTGEAALAAGRLFVGWDTSPRFGNAVCMQDACPSSGTAEEMK